MSQHTRDPILATGASGLLGANFIQTARQFRRQIVGVYHRHPVAFTGTKAIGTDLTRPQNALNLMQSERPEWVVHCAALTSVDGCQDNPEAAWQTNVGMTQNLAAAAHQTGARFVYISTDSVFDGKNGNYRETDAPSPLNVYAQTKLAGEQVAQQEAPNCLIVRTNIYGWNLQKKMSLAEWILSRLETRQPVPGFADVTFSPILVNDLSIILLNMMARNLEGIYHVCGAQTISKYNFARRLAETFAYDASQIHPTSIAASPLKAPRPQHTSLCTDKVVHALNSPLPDVDAGLQHFKKLNQKIFANTG